MKVAKKELIYIAMVTLTILILLLIITEIPKIKRDLQTNIRNSMVQTVSSMLTNIEIEFHRIASSHPKETIEQVLQKNPRIRSDLETMLSILIAEDIKYCYVVFRDSDGKFRFMLDGSTEEKADFGKKFDIEDPAWEKAYETRRPQLIKQSTLTSLWITHLQPIVINDKVEGIIAADFSLDGYQQIIGILEPLQKYIWIFLGLMFLGIIVSVVQYLLYRLTQREVFIDSLTGTYNRNFLNDIIKTLDYQKYAVAMLDLDKFKIVNDTYGHEMGDQVLRKVGSILKSSIREYDKLIRYGGEEFIIFISMRDTDQEEVIRIMERLRHNVEAISIEAGLIVLKPTVSIGLNTYTSHFKNEHDAIAIADKMLYEAKRTGRNKIISYSPSVTKDTKEMTYNVYHVKEAIEEKRLFCEYQPIIQLQTHEIIGYEALIRIRDRNGKVVYPGMFLPNIAHSHIYKELTLELLRMNFEKVHQTSCPISINLNITDILDDDIYHTILIHLNDSPQEAKFLTFELLEEEQITHLKLLKERLTVIRSFNAKFSIDDFGTGFSNFSHIFSLDIDIIKIDGSLIKEIGSSEVSRKLVESIVAFAKASKKRVIAEFIHSAEVLECVKELGISCGQGFYLGKPGEILSSNLKDS